jgi:cytochrome c553
MSALDVAHYSHNENRISNSAYWRFSMKYRHLLLAMTLGMVGTGCTNIEHSRDLANQGVSATMLAQQLCSLCHGVDGRLTNPTFPNLVGQQPGYFIAQMKGFRSHGRMDPAGTEYMWGVSRSLTDDQIKALADYYGRAHSSGAGCGQRSGRGCKGQGRV